MKESSLVSSTIAPRRTRSPTPTPTRTWWAVVGRGCWSSVHGRLGGSRAQDPGREHCLSQAVQHPEARCMHHACRVGVLDKALVSQAVSSPWGQDVLVVGLKEDHLLSPGPAPRPSWRPKRSRPRPKVPRRGRRWSATPGDTACGCPLRRTRGPGNVVTVTSQAATKCAFAIRK